MRLAVTSDNGVDGFNARNTRFSLLTPSYPGDSCQLSSRNVRATRSFPTKSRNRTDAVREVCEVPRSLVVRLSLGEGR